jgi:hypothetical protein
MRFIIDGGDGDQSYFGHSFAAERVIEPWFPRKIPRGRAYLLRIITGVHKGEYLALTSKVIASLDEQLKAQNYLSVVVHLVKSPGADFVADEANLPAIGMAIIEAVRPRKPAIFKNPW